MNFHSQREVRLSVPEWMKIIIGIKLIRKEVLTVRVIVAGEFLRLFDSMGKMMGVDRVTRVMLLLVTGRPGAALERREAASEGVPGVPGVPEPTDFLSRHLQSLTELVARELPPQLRPEELRSQAELYLGRANAQLEPLARELQSGVMGLFSSLLRLGTPGTPEETP